MPSNDPLRERDGGGTLTTCEPSQVGVGVRRSWRDALFARLESARRGHVHRALRTPSAELVDLAGNDFLALRRHPRLIAAVESAAREFGVGSGASRLVSGTSELHSRIERRFAAFKGAEAALILPTGYMANLALLPSLAAPGDLLLMDRLNHASLFDAALLAARGAGGVQLRRYRHRDVNHARDLALRHLARRPDCVVWLVSDSVFSMDGDCAPIVELAELRDELTSARCGLILDEAHATGVMGRTGAGADEVAGRRADICVSTASKALGSIGGIITGPRLVMDAVINFSRPFIFTTAVPPTQLASIDAALDVVHEEPHRRERVHQLAGSLRCALIEKGWPRDRLGENPTSIIPLIVGTPECAMALSAELEGAGFFAPAIRPPSVPAGTCRIRLALNSAITDAQLEALIGVIPPYDDP